MVGKLYVNGEEIDLAVDSGQIVTLSIDGVAPEWGVKFYSTTDPWKVIATAVANVQGHAQTSYKVVNTTSIVGISDKDGMQSNRVTIFVGASINMMLVLIVVAIIVVVYLFSGRK